MSNTQPQRASKRGRPTATRAASIDRSILAAALELFLRDGFDPVTMEAVAATAGVSKTTLYDRYSSKEELFDAVIRERIQQWSAISSAQDHLLTDDIAQRLHYHARSLAVSMLTPEVRAFQRLVLANADRFPRLARAMYEAGYLYIVDLIRRDIEDAAARDGRPVRNAEEVARHFVAAITGWNIQESSAREIGTAEAEAAAARSADLVLASRDLW